MMRILTTAALTAGLLWAGAASAADALAECYRTADNKVAVQACLKKELDQTQKEYDDIVDRILAKARDLDRIQKRRNEAAKAFTDANKAFERYVDAECGWLEESYGAGTGSGNAVLACRINLIKTRSGALDAQFLSASH
jgi:hypothetical protein